MDSSMWDERYRSAELLWSAEPNQFVRDFFSERKPGRVVDLGCGEGRNAIWLAEQGWQVTGVDFSQVALERAATLAEGRGVSGEWVRADLSEWSVPEPTYDAALICYIHLPRPVMTHLFNAALASLLTGGELLVVGHHSRNLTEGVGGPQMPEVLYSPADVTEILGAENVVEARDVFRNVETGEGAKVAIDTYVVARRT
ncbi:MAG: class I SAM-dependent methyltransferase [Actinomycetota bacterium]|nr:class I SAM-dependent methyltransferase [Actinomycetota bacterium]